MKKTIIVLIILISFSTFAQQDSTAVEQSNIQNYTPSKLLEKGKLDIKWFNNLYTQTERTDKGLKSTIARESYFTTSLEIFTGVSNNKKLNAGLIVEYRYNVFTFQDNPLISFINSEDKIRSGLSHIAPSIKVSPFNKSSNFSIQSSLFIPVFKEETNENGFLAANSYIWQNRFFYDYTFKGNKFQLFTELSTRLFFGEKSLNDDKTPNKNGGYANNSLELAPSVFLSYFASSKSTVFTFVQHSQLLDLGNNFEQNYSAVGFGAKYQLSKVLNVETIYSKFVRGADTGLGQSFNLGLRAIF
ncbi:hypothetical protein [Flavobacterium sp.]|uniref:hypothetical protein n=1 Tax=Flavobacterium sp. TaxID=239 RepID=UPI0037500EA2